ncbi:spore cortex-lytic enzyme [Mammaliicoccus sciuri]|uniref:Spore cortex-lytic enzyme n=1 Tax=Sporosarcina newyorkensis TaxID=759851 RepID=A0A1T4XD51_9BACL|nr:MULTISPECIES: spore cortex-lytic enzyme [Sporosarcina]MBY0222686.1 spore cortex-lytic enzyme [Sporosarcina aquimarina]SKA87389.1 N-acetylmuramoyl-L-alanine amidase [Sporosarcina newyorkensis]
MKRVAVRFLFLLIAGVMVLSLFVIQTEAFSARDLAKGAKGDDVIELQARLQYIGFYHGEIDGNFGYGTYWALRNFQEQYGMPVDGIVGKNVKKKLQGISDYDEKYVKGQIAKGNQFTYYGGQPLEAQVKKGSKPQKQMQTPAKYSDQDIKLLANAVYGEARGEPYEGQVAVAAVILNRIEHADFPDTVGGVIFQPGAFTAVSDGQIWLTPNERAKEAVIDAINGWDPSENAIYYFNPITATSKWIWSRPQIKKIGLHIFCN